MWTIRPWTKPVNGYALLGIIAFAVACFLLRSYQANYVLDDELGQIGSSVDGVIHFGPLKLNTYGLLNQEMLRKSCVNVGTSPGHILPSRGIVQSNYLRLGFKLLTVYRMWPTQ